MDDLPENLEELYSYPDIDRPWLRSNFVTTLDGAAFDADGKSGALGGAADTEVFALLRSMADLIVVGAGTARKEGYEPVKPNEVDAELRKRHGLSSLPAIAVVSKSLNIPKPLRAPGQIVITVEDGPQAAVDELRTTVDVIAAGHGDIDWPAVLDELADRGFRRILCEGGPTLHGTLIGLDLLDELCLSIAPVMSGGSAPRIAHGNAVAHNDMHLGHCLDIGDLLLTRWTRERAEND